MMIKRIKILARKRVRDLSGIQVFFLDHIYCM